MASKILMSVQDYLHRSFEDGDRDYVDGAAIERNVGEWWHSTVQTNLLWWLLQRREQLAIQILPCIRLRIDDARYRVADIGVWQAASKLGWNVPKVSPVLVIEILDFNDSLPQMLERAADYLRAGTRTVWLIHPGERWARTCLPDWPTGEIVENLAHVDPSFSIRLRDVLPPVSFSTA